MYILFSCFPFFAESRPKKFFFTFLDLNETHQNRHSHIDCGLQGLLSYTCLGEQLNYSYINLFTVYKVDIISIWLTDSATCPTQSKLVLYLLAQFSQTLPTCHYIVLSVQECRHVTQQLICFHETQNLWKERNSGGWDRLYMWMRYLLINTGTVPDLGVLFLHELIKITVNSKSR